MERLATAIRLGVYPYGSTLPPERELARRMGVSRATLREAIAALRTAGMVSTTRGRGGGTVVSYRPATPALGGSPGIAERRDELLDAALERVVPADRPEHDVPETVRGSASNSVDRIHVFGPRSMRVPRRRDRPPSGSGP